MKDKKIHLVHIIFYCVLYSIMIIVFLYNTPKVFAVFILGMLIQHLINFNEWAINNYNHLKDKENDK